MSAAAFARRSVPLFSELLARHDLRRSHVVMYSLIVEADAVGACPRVKVLARYAGLHEKTARECLRRLEGVGLIRRDYAPGQPTKYTVLGPRIDEKATA